MIDPPRLEVRDSIALCREAGITPVMITGDHRETAFAIAKELGIARFPDEAVFGAELDDLTDHELVERASALRVYARVSPEHKVRIVKAIRGAGNIVSMTGDGVNDAPSLKAADIGVAMGITGTDVSKGASDMILTDDNFKTIVSAVREGGTSTKTSASRSSSSSPATRARSRPCSPPSSSGGTSPSYPSISCGST
jgi:Ca2+-transporting ATPase